MLIDDAFRKIEDIERRVGFLEAQIKVVDAAFAAMKYEKEVVHDEVKEWKCPHCGKDEGTWFDRTLDENENMATRCNACGVDIDAETEVKKKNDKIYKKLMDTVEVKEEKSCTHCAMTKEYARRNNNLKRTV